MFRECSALCVLAGAMSLGCGGHSRSAGQNQTLEPPPVTTSYCADDTSPRALLPLRYGQSVAVSLDVRGSQLLFSVQLVDDFANARDGELSVVDLESGSSRLVASGRQSPSYAVIGGQDAYWLEAVDVENGITRAPLAGGGEPVSEWPASSGTVVVDDYLYYGRNAALMALPLKGGSEVQLSTEAVALELASDGEYVYFSSCGSGIERVHKLGGALEHVADAACPVAVAADQDHVFFASVEPGGAAFRLFRAPSAGGRTEPFSDESLHPVALAVDADSVYAGDESGLHRISRELGEPELLASGSVGDIALDEHCIYFADSKTRTPYVLRKD